MAWNNIIHLITSSISHQTSSNCTGGRVTMLFDTASQNKIQGTKAMRKFVTSFIKSI